MVVLAPGAEIRASDIPGDILEGPGTLLPVRVLNRDQPAGGHELEFILRSLVELKLQVEELKRRLDDLSHGAVDRLGPGQWIGDGDGDRPVVYRPGMTMAEVEKAAIEAALQEYRGNRRKAAEVLGIGERTLYRKIKAYRLE
jgi:DNA-binding NtrC family response regulator